MANLKAYLNVFESWFGYNEADGSDDIIIDLYNSQREQGTYKMSHVDPWCHATISAAAYKSGNTGIVPNTAYCPTGINWFKNRNQWKARSTGYKPSIGDIVYYDWSNGKDRISDHVGVIIAVNGTVLVVREGNKNNRLEDRNISMYSASIMGYGIPKWDSQTNNIVDVNTVITPNNGDTYTVKRGDCLSAIAKAHNVTVRDLVEWNKISNPDIINVGQVLKVKGTSTVENKKPQTTTKPDSKVNEWVLKLQQQLNIQFGAGLVEDGIAGPITLGATVVVSYGAQGEITKLIQEKVKAVIDGEFGPETEKAVKTYQKNKKLIIDGIVGHETWRSLLGL